MTLIKSVSIAGRFQRSVRLDADVKSTGSLEGFRCQRSAGEALTGMVEQIAQSSQRAFTWTGPYGGGKSSLALAFAALVGAEGARRAAAKAAFGKDLSATLLSALHPSREGWLIVPVVGRRTDPIAEIAEALRTASGSRRPPPSNSKELIGRLVKEAGDRPRDGVLLLIDELGKFLEGAARDRGDIHFFQELAEAAARSSGKLIVVGILHQAFEQYAARLGSVARDDWAKIQGRYADIPLVAGVDEVVDLVGRAIQSKKPAASKVSAAVASDIARRRPTAPSDLGARLDNCWPLHPVTALLLGPMSRKRFGQNERSVFGFLSSSEPAAFREYLQNTDERTSRLFDPPMFWDYLRINLEPAILASNESHRWAQAADAVERAEGRGGDIHVRLAKSIATIEMFKNGSGLAASRDVLLACLNDQKPAAVEAALEDLARWSVVVFRKHTNSWAIFAGSDFDIDDAIRRADATIAELDLVKLGQLAGLQPVLAKKHYYETGTLRWFQYELARAASLEGARFSRTDADGRFLLIIPDGNENRDQLFEMCSRVSAANKGLLAIGIPNNATRISELGRELLSLEKVSKQPELEGDAIARREVQARIAATIAELSEELRTDLTGADWFVAGKRRQQAVGASLSRFASDMADQTFPMSPRIKSELVNRDRPSSNTQAGIRVLLHAMVTQADQKHLGIEGFPIERGLYSTLLEAPGLHRLRGNKWRFGQPDTAPESIGSTYAAAWAEADRLLDNDSGAISLDVIYDAWAQSPFGIRKGILPVLAVAYALGKRSSLALYADNQFAPEIDDYFIDRLLQDPALIALRRIDRTKSKTEMIAGLAATAAKLTGEECAAEPLDVARRLVKFVYDLPPWARKSLGLSAQAMEVRRILLAAHDPHRTLLVDLPGVFEASSPSATVKKIETSLKELRDAYPKMLQHLTSHLLQALGHDTPEDLEDLRQRAATVRDLKGELRDEAFAGRLATFTGAEKEIESIVGFSINRPVRDWSDRDPDVALLALAELAVKFRRNEMLAHIRGQPAHRQAFAVLIGTGQGGNELIETFEVKGRDKDAIAGLSVELSKILKSADRSIALAALAQTGLTLSSAARGARRQK
jgi:hypothetical protein